MTFPSQQRNVLERRLAHIAYFADPHHEVCARELDLSGEGQDGWHVSFQDVLLEARRFVAVMKDMVIK